MIASWMLYACLVGALVTIAALALDRVAGARRWPLRIVWFGALLLSVGWPLGTVVVRRLMPAPVAAVRVLPFTITVQPSRIIAGAAVAPFGGLSVDRSLIAIWAVASLLLLLRVSQGVIILQRTRGRWTRRTVDGTTVRLSENVGPAVVGLRSMDVVLPAWILTLDAPLRAIVLRHEEEHRAARDPYLLFAAALAVALMPWNLALWLQARRLRLAIELDCDARVLRAHPSPERYGMLILTIAQRRSVAPTLFAPMLSEPTTQLERRILAMRNRTQHVTRATVYGAAVVAVGVLALAGSLQAADGGSSAPIASRLLPKIAVPAPIADVPAALSLTPRTEPRPTSAAVATTPAGQPAAESAQPGNPAPRYPDMLLSANIEGTVVVEFTTDRSGVPNLSTLRVLKSTHDLFTNAIKAVLPLWHLAPNVNAHLPFVFTLAAGNDMVASPRRTVDGIDAIVVTGIAPTTRPASPERVAMIDSARSNRNTVAVMGGVATVAPAARQASGPQPVNEHQTFFEFQVERAASLMPGNIGPRYPDSLRVAQVEGEVLAQFVVDTLGRADPSTFKVLKSTHEMFTNTVLATLPNLRFFPALVGGRPVKQLVQMPFNFSLSK